MRCKWCNLDNPVYVKYHDEEWGVLNLDEHYLFEMLILESFQAGLSWECVLNKRDAFRKAYDNFEIEKVIKYDDIKINELINNKDIIPEVENTQDWFLEIPSINLKAFIQEGTSKDVLEKYVGHFVETSKDTGNIGLAAHNRGYENNYFENLKKLKQGDIIYYQYNGIKKQYQVTKTSIIKDDDWTNLEQTQNNTITLITCVENQPEYRRCIQGKEK